MASLLDLSLLNVFSNVFVILFIFAASYAVLLFKHPFGDNKGINALLAATISIIFIFSQDAIEVIKDTVPWFIVMMIGLMFVLMVTKSFDVAVPPSVTGSVGTWVLIIGIVILMINVSM